MKTVLKKITILCFFLCIVISCSDADSFNRHLNEQLKNYYLEDLDTHEFIVIIPRQGCRSCIESAENFFKATKDDERFLFIFTRVVSAKQLKLEIGKENTNLKNVRVDMKSLFYSPKYMDSGYPLLLHKEKNGEYSYKKLIEQ